MLRRLINTHQIGRQTTSRETVSAEKVDSCASFPVCKFKNSKQIGAMGKKNDSITQTSKRKNGHEYNSPDSLKQIRNQNTQKQNAPSPFATRVQLDQHASPMSRTLMAILVTSVSVFLNKIITSTQMCLRFEPVQCTVGAVNS